MNGDLYVIETNDGGFITTGQHDKNGAGNCDIYAFKKDACGKLIWYMTYGAGGSDGGTCIQQTTDGGYIISGLYTVGSNYDACLLKIDANGNQQWLKTYGDGGGNDEYGMFVQQTNDGGYILAGHTRSFGAGASDVYIVKTDNAGNVQWEKTFGGGGEELASFIQQTSDDGYIIAGATTSFGAGGYDLWLIKINGSGTFLWSKTYGGGSDDGTWWMNRAPICPDGGYILSAYTASFGAGSNDIIFIKTDSTGNVQWANAYGGGGDDQSRYSTVTPDGGYGSTGYTRSFGAGGMDEYLLKTDNAGNIQWARTYGSGGDEKAMCVQYTSDGGYVLCGNTSSFGASYYDIYFVKTDSIGMTTCNAATQTFTATAIAPTVNSITPTITSPTASASQSPSQESVTPQLNRLCIQCSFFAKFEYCKNQLQLTLSDSSKCIPTNWFWDFGDGFTSTQQNPLHSYSTPGTYTVTYTALDSSTTCSGTVIKAVIIDTVPVAKFVATDNRCLGTPTQFTDISTYGTIYAWYWDFGDGSVDSVSNPSHLYAAPGTYFAELKVRYDNNCLDSLTIPVNVRPIPMADFTSNNVCLNVPTPFSDLSTVSSGTIQNWVWDFGDGTGPSTQLNPSHTYASPQIYQVTLGVTTTYGCPDTVIKNIEVYPLPVADFGASEVCYGFPTVFTDSATITGDTIVNWYWDFGDGFGDILTNTIHTYGNSGQYQVEIKVVSDEGCADSLTKSVTVDPLPVPVFSVNPVCENDSAHFSNNSYVIPGSVAGSLWYFGDGDSSLLTNPAHLYSDGNYTITLGVITDKGCYDTVMQGLTIYPLPVPGFSFLSACAKDTVFFTDTSGVTSGFIIAWQWNFGDGSGTSFAKSPPYIFNNPDTYNVRLVVVTDKGCMDTVIKPVEIYPLPVAGFIATETCFGNPNSFTDNSAISSGTVISWLWDFGDTSGSSGTSVSHTYNSYGTFSAELEISSGYGCLDSITKTVTVNPLPVAGFSVSNVCQDNPAVFSDTSKIPYGNIVAREWYFGDGDSSSMQNPGHIYIAGYYVVTLEVTSAKSCTDTAQRGLIIYPEPVADFSFVQVCTLDTTAFSDLSTVNPDTVNRWLWNFGDGTPNDTNQNPSHIYATKGFYSVNLIVQTNNGCNDTIIKQVEAYVNPIAWFTSNKVCKGNSTTFTDGSSQDTIVNFFWTFGDGTGTSALQNPTYQYGSAGSFYTILSVNTDEGCNDTSGYWVIVYPLPAPYFYSDTLSGCSPLTVQFTDTSKVSQVVGLDSIAGWIWDFGDGPGTNTQNPLHVYNNTSLSTETYTVTLQVSSSKNCLASEIKQDFIEVYPLPVADFIYYPDSPSILFPNITFTDLSLLASDWWWNFGDGDSSKMKNPQHLYKDTGLYRATLIVKNLQGCFDTIYYDVHIYSDYSIFIPTAFSPNNDAINDEFKIRAIGIKTFNLLIFDRWGDEVFRTNDINTGWKGIANKGTNMSQQDVFVYRVDVRDVLGYKHVYTGHVTLVK